MDGLGDAARLIQMEAWGGGGGGVHAAQPGGGVSMGRPSRGSTLPRLERVLERSMMVCLLGLFKTERLAREMSAVTRVMEILRDGEGTSGWGGRATVGATPPLCIPTLPRGAGWDPPSAPVLLPPAQGYLELEPPPQTT